MSGSNLFESAVGRGSGAADRTTDSSEGLIECALARIQCCGCCRIVGVESELARYATAAVSASAALATGRTLAIAGLPGTGASAWLTERDVADIKSFLSEALRKTKKCFLDSAAIASRSSDTETVGTNLVAAGVELGSDGFVAKVDICALQNVSQIQAAVLVDCCVREFVVSGVSHACRERKAGLLCGERRAVTICLELVGCRNRVTTFEIVDARDPTGHLFIATPASGEDKGEDGQSEQPRTAR